MGIFRSTNPADWNQVDQIIIDEVAPPSQIGGVPTNIAILVGQFERGDDSQMIEVGSTGEIFQNFGNNISFSGLVALQNKKFGRLKIVRVTAAAAAKAAKTFQHTATDIITFTALWKGAYGNSITVKIEAGSTSGSKYTVHDGNANAVFPDEVYDNVVITSIAGANPFATSNLISVTVIATSNEPDTAVATALTGGSSGSVADTDYQAAIGKTEIEGAGNILFLDAYNSTRNGYLKTSMANTTDKMCIVCGQSGDSVSTAVADAANNRDTDGRIIYAYPYIYTTVNGANTLVNPASFYASLLSQIAPNIDPAWAGNSQYLAGVNQLGLNLSRANYIALMAAGISAFEIDSDIGPKIKSGVVTQIADSAKIMIFRRRMTDYLTYSIAKFLKMYQNAVNSQENRVAAGAAIHDFNGRIEREGLVPTDKEVSTGKASIIDVNSLNTDSSIAQGYFKILFRRRIHSSMRFIVLQAQIGESVVVTELQ